MQTFVYIIVRTYPFWAIPLGFVLIAGWLRSKAKDARGKSLARLFLLTALILLSTSGAYLYYLGYYEAVQLFYEVMNPDKSLSSR